MRRKYKVVVEADFEVYASSPEEIRSQLYNIIRKNGFDSKNFEIAISRIPQTKASHVSGTQQQSTEEQQSTADDETQQGAVKQKSTVVKPRMRKRRSIDASGSKAQVTLNDLFEKYAR